MVALDALGYLAFTDHATPFINGYNLAVKCSLSVCFMHAAYTGSIYICNAEMRRRTSCSRIQQPFALHIFSPASRRAELGCACAHANSICCVFFSKKAIAMHGDGL